MRVKDTWAVARLFGGRYGFHDLSLSLRMMMKSAFRSFVCCCFCRFSLRHPSSRPRLAECMYVRTFERAYALSQSFFRTT